MLIHFRILFRFGLDNRIFKEICDVDDTVESKYSNVIIEYLCEIETENILICLSRNKMDTNNEKIEV